MKYRSSLNGLMALFMLAGPVLAKNLVTNGAGVAMSSGAEHLHRQIASPVRGYFSPKEQFNGAGASVTSPIGGYTANGFMSPSGQPMTSPQGPMSQSTSGIK
ncbi:MAG: hypothetical protein ACYCXG_03785 [Acidiferrobacter sp.]